MTSEQATASLSLTIRHTIAATAEQLFDAWTKPELLTQWWGPEHVECPTAEVDLQVGGQYRIANQLPDGNIIWISGKFEKIERPNKLVYSWLVDANPTSPERVIVQFKPQENGTEVIVVHQRIATKETQDKHRIGWQGCLTGLTEFSAEAT